MFFCIKNADEAYEHMVNMTFVKHIDQNMEVYVDNMLVKSKQTSSQNADLVEAFNVLSRYQMKLNPIKCTFRVASASANMVHEQGIEANLDKIRAILEKERTKNLKPTSTPQWSARRTQSLCAKKTLSSLLCYYKTQPCGCISSRTVLYQPHMIVKFTRKE